MKKAVLLSTYNSPEALRKTLLGYTCQSDPDFELVICDDGSDGRTHEVLEIPAFASLRLRHIWQEDRGYRRSLILNKGIRESRADYLIFSDADCIPRNDFVAQHAAYARRGRYLSAHRLDIAEEIHTQFTDEDIVSNRVFDVDYLAAHDPKLRGCRRRLQRDSALEHWRNLLTYRPAFTGSNASAWREDLLRINGFDGDFTAYGSEDRDVGARLANLGVRPKFMKFTLVQIHLHHPKPWVDRDVMKTNRRIFRARASSGVTRVENGLDHAGTDSR